MCRANNGSRECEEGQEELARLQLSSAWISAFSGGLIATRTVPVGLQAAAREARLLLTKRGLQSVRHLDDFLFSPPAKARPPVRHPSARS